MKKFLLIVFLLTVGFIGGLTLGAVTGGYGGSVVGICIYNEVALSTQSITAETSETVAKALAQKIFEEGEELQWLAEHTDISGSDLCVKFAHSVQSELDRLKSAPTN